MRFANDALVILILGGALYVLYRSVWKNKGQCPDCVDHQKVKKKVFK